MSKYCISRPRLNRTNYRYVKQQKSASTAVEAQPIDEKKLENLDFNARDIG